MPRPPSYDSVLENAKHGGDLNAGMHLWYSMARAEWSMLAGQDLAFKEARSRWESPVKVAAQPWLGASVVSSVWRALARRADEVGRVLERRQAITIGQTIAMEGHVAAAKVAHHSLSNTIRASVGPVVQAWATAFQ